MTITETIDLSIEELIEKLVGADALEAGRIHTRISELKSLKEKHATT